MDIVERLRDGVRVQMNADGSCSVTHCQLEAADTIESLSAENAALKESEEMNAAELEDFKEGFRSSMANLSTAQARIKELREALGMIELLGLNEVDRNDASKALATPYDDAALRTHDAALLRKVAEKLELQGYPASGVALRNEALNIERGEG